mgnify:CR=1 FL=1|jgi:hypothetical protein|tara:strand:- start:285 stop:719 length:435 start_codon:yes stop_codon:yes gene_type:complete
MTKAPNLTDIAYLAGLFDGEGCVQYKQYIDSKRKNRPKPYKVWRITLEMSMTDKPVMEWVHELVKCGTFSLNVKNKSPSSKPYYKDQWRWRCSHRDAYQVAKLMWPFAQVKLHQLEQIIDHYEPSYPDSNVVSIHGLKMKNKKK